MGVRRDGKGGPPVQTTLWEGLCAGCWKAGRGCAVGGGVGVKEELQALSEARRWAPPTWEGRGGHRGWGLARRSPPLKSPALGLFPQVLTALDRDASCRKQKLRQKLEHIIGLASSNS